MSSAKDIAHGFTITGLLDESAKTRSQYPVVEIPVDEIIDHPENTVYSMEAAGIKRLAQSIKEQGLTDLPLVRKLDDGSYQMVSGHRRKAAFSLLSRTDDAFHKMPCRVIEGIDEKSSVMLLHAANYFTRELSITERAKATRALGLEVERRRSEDASLSGVRTEDVKAAIIEEQTGRKVSGKTIKRQEALAELIETRLISSWRKKAEEALLTASCIESLALLSETAQVLLYDNLPEDASTKAMVSKYVQDALAERKAESEKVSLERNLALALRESVHPNADTRLKAALSALKSYLTDPPLGAIGPDVKASALIRCLSGYLPESEHGSQDEAQSRLRRA